MERASLYLDEHIQAALVQGLRARGVDVLTTQEAKSNHRRLAHSCRGEACLRPVGCGLPVGDHKDRPYLLPEAVSQCRVVRFSNRSLDDQGQLTFAVAQRRTLLSYNERHFAKLHYDWMKAGREHAGIILSDQLPDEF